MDNGEDGLHLAQHGRLPLGSARRRQEFLAPKAGKSKLIRDPCLLRLADGTFQMVWSDGDNQTIGHASSKDLLHWSEQQAIGVMTHEPRAISSWAPEWSTTRTRNST